MLRKHWNKLIVLVFCSLFCMTSVMPLQVQAAGEAESQQAYAVSAAERNGLSDRGRVQFGSFSNYVVNPDGRGSLTIHDQYGDGVDYYLYQVAEFSREGPAYYTDAFSRYSSDLAALSNEIGTASQQQQLMGELMQFIASHSINASSGPVPVDENGDVSFREMLPGYYLVLTNASDRADGKIYSSRPLLISMPEGADGSLGTMKYDISIDAKSELKDPPTSPATEDPPTSRSESSTPLQKLTGKLPQTGVLWWPVPVFFVSGLFFYFLGIFLDRRKGNA